MKRYRFDISGQKLPLESAADFFTLEERPGGWIILTTKEGARLRAMGSIVGEEASFSIGGKLFRGKLVSDQADRKGGASQGSESDLQAQFPGKVVKVLVKVGDAVEVGTVMLVQEAMKMEFSIKAPFKGKIKAVNVSPGAQVSQGEKFVEIDRDL